MFSYSGTLALSFTALPQSATCRLSKIKQAPTATWLQSSTLATLTFDVQHDGNLSLQASATFKEEVIPEGAPLLFARPLRESCTQQVHLKGVLMLHICNAVAYSLLSPEETGRGWIFAATCPERNKAGVQVRACPIHALTAT